MAAGLAPAQFIDDVEEFMQGKTAEEQLEKIGQQLQNFKQQEQVLLLRRERLQERQPEIKMALEAVVGLIEQKEQPELLLVDFELTENIYAKAAVQDVDSVNLWLGANVMVEYPLAEARDVLAHNLQNCDSSLKAVAKELESVKNSITITEVSLARVFNWDVEHRRKLKAKQGPAGAGGSSS